MDYGRKKDVPRQSQAGSGSGPFAEIHDTLWKGTITCPVPIVCLALVATADAADWVKSADRGATQFLQLSLSRYVDSRPDVATFAVRIGGAHLPSFHVKPDSAAGSRFVVEDTTNFVTGQVRRIAHVSGLDVLVLLLPGKCVAVGRKRVWRLRPDLAALLPPISRAMLTQGRSGKVRIRDAKSEADSDT